MCVEFVETCVDGASDDFPINDFNCNRFPNYTQFNSDPPNCVFGGYAPGKFIVDTCLPIHSTLLVNICYSITRGPWALMLT